jgi:hypothetical protein
MEASLAGSMTLHPQHWLLPVAHERQRYNAPMPRFVVLYHEMPPESERPSHCDVMLEHDGILRTWAVASPPASGRVQRADALSDHRLAYLDYEGPVSGARGSVRRWDSGEFRWLIDSPQRLEAELRGTHLLGTLVLAFSPAGEAWELTFTPASL